MKPEYYESLSPLKKFIEVSLKDMSIPHGKESELHNIHITYVQMGNSPVKMSCASCVFSMLKDVWKMLDNHSEPKKENKTALKGKVMINHKN
jgi:hypothetical protein